MAEEASLSGTLLPTPSSAVLWLRSDLRLHDQPLVTAGVPGKAVWVYVFDLRFLSRRVALPGELGTLHKASARRALFVLQSVRDLAARISRELGGASLIVRAGRPEEEIGQVAESLGWSCWDVHCQHELGTEEEAIQERVAATAARMGQGKLHATWGRQFLYCPDDVIASLGTDPRASLVNPQHFWSDDVADEDDGMESVVPICQVTGCLPEGAETRRFLRKLPNEIADPCGLLTLPESEALVRLGYSPEAAQEACLPDPRAVLLFHGGESAALARLEAWIRNGGLRRYYDDRSGVLGADYSSKLSPWLAAGCISPARVYRRIREEGYDDSIRWLASELVWRDLFRYHLLYHGSDVFKAGGPSKASHRPWRQDKHLFEAWCSGQTGIHWVDAHMRELAASGFMSNTGRQLVASFLSCCLGVDWRLGAMWFEATLIDHDVALNYGNWNREARVRWSPRWWQRREPADADEGRRILAEEHSHLMARLASAARGEEGTCYDTTAFIRLWIPELREEDPDCMCRRTPPPLYEVLCSGCSALDRSSVRKGDGVLCGDCRDVCAWCGQDDEGELAHAAKRQRYCTQCWDDWQGG